MNILFFQNCVSPHQTPFIQYLPYCKDIEDVIIIVPEKDLEEREKMGWNSSLLLHTPNIKFLISPSILEIQNLYHKYNNSNTWCMYSGINAFPFVSACFKESLKYNIKRGIITEPPFIYNHPIWQHAIRFAIKDLRYTKYIDKIFIMGDNFLNYYRFWSNRWKVIPFMYCTTWYERKSLSPTTNKNKLKILYVGSLSHRKNVQLLLNAVCRLKEEQQTCLHIGIIGDGEEKQKLATIAASNKNIDVTFYGTKPMNVIPTIMEQYDILCLPSLYDGWGAVVNEALTLGLYVICSTSCGSKFLITQSHNLCGNLFKNKDINSLCKVLKECIKTKDEIQQNIRKRIEWAKNNIHGEVVAQYFIDQLKS